MVSTSKLLALFCCLPTIRGPRASSEAPQRLHELSPFQMGRCLRAGVQHFGAVTASWTAFTSTAIKRPVLHLESCTSGTQGFALILAGILNNRQVHLFMDQRVHRRCQALGQQRRCLDLWNRSKTNMKYLDLRIPWHEPFCSCIVPALWRIRKELGGSRHAYDSAITHIQASSLLARS